MAPAVVNANMFLAPQGDLEVEYFPDDSDVSARLSGYIDEAKARLEGLSLIDSNYNSALRAWVYHRAYHTIWVNLSANPNSMVLADQGSRSYNQGQIDSFRILARDYLLEYNDLIGELPKILRNAPSTGATPNSYVW